MCIKNESLTFSGGKKKKKKKKEGKNVKHTFILTGVMLLVTPGS